MELTLGYAVKNVKCYVIVITNISVVIINMCFPSPCLIVELLTFKTVTLCVYLAHIFNLIRKPATGPSFTLLWLAAVGGHEAMSSRWESSNVK